MSTDHRFSEDDVGKPVVDVNDDTVGIVEDVENGTAYVDPDPGLAGKIKSRLGWSDEDATDAETFALPDRYVDSVTDDEVRLET